MSKNYLQPIVRIDFNTASLSTNYQLATAATGLPEGLRLIKFVNSSNQDVDISYDGTNNHDLVRSETDWPLYAQQLAEPANNVAKMKAGTLIYVKGAAAGTGVFSIIGYF